MPSGIYKHKLRGFRQTIDRICQICGKKFTIFKSRLKYGKNQAKYCSYKCYRIYQRSPEYPLTGSNSPFWKGGCLFDKTGYVRIYKPNHPKAYQKYILEHRLVMEQHLGRYLKKGEIVHHIDGNRHNNKIENLQLFTRATHRNATTSKIFTCPKCNFQWKQRH